MTLTNTDAELIINPADVHLLFDDIVTTEPAPTSDAVSDSCDNVYTLPTAA